MGGSSSKSTYEELTKIGYDIANSNTQRCTTSASQSQLVNLRGNKGTVKLGNISQQQGVSIDVNCLFSSTTQNDIQTQLARQITQFAEAKGGDVTAGFGNSSSEVNTNIKNLFQTNINNQSLAESVTSALQSQVIDLALNEGTIIAADQYQNQSAEVISKAMMDSVQYSGVLQDIATKIDQTAKSKGGGIFSNMFDMIGGIFGDLKGVIMSIAIAVVVAIALGVLVYGGKKAYDMMQSGKAPQAPRVRAPSAPAYTPRAIPPPPL